MYTYSKWHLKWWENTDINVIIGFNHGVLGLAENPALGPGFFRQNTSGYALGVLTPKASPSGWVFSQAQHPMIKTYNVALVPTLS